MRVGVDAGERARRVRRGGIVGGAIGGSIGAVVMAVEWAGSGFPWWVALPVALFGTVSGAVGGWRFGREDRAQKDDLEPNETVLNDYGVWPSPAPPPGRATSKPEYAPLRLHTTTRRLRLWEGETLLWAHPWSEVRCEADGPRLRVLHREVEIALVEGVHSVPDMPEEFCRTAERIAARFGHR
ncbi:hypothetical protein ACFW6S_21690 [Streptomyces sp. NPDC058740]|uniref:hypothetical protein n=1 Tax=Streptomyces sp. NPDC058740 TaxID=3346619 RepID=UPI0036A1DE8F